MVLQNSGIPGKRYKKEWGRVGGHLPNCSTYGTPSVAEMRNSRACNNIFSFATRYQVICLPSQGPLRVRIATVIARVFYSEACLSSDFLSDSMVRHGGEAEESVCEESRKNEIMWFGHGVVGI